MGMWSVTRCVTPFSGREDLWPFGGPQALQGGAVLPRLPARPVNGAWVDLVDLEDSGVTLLRGETVDLGRASRLGSKDARRDRHQEVCSPFFGPFSF